MHLPRARARSDHRKQGERALVFEGFFARHPVADAEQRPRRTSAGAAADHRACARRRRSARLCAYRRDARIAAHGIVPDVIAGTSIGAVVGGCFAGGRARRAREVGAQPHACAACSSYLDINLSGSGLISGTHLAKQLLSRLSDTLIDDLPMRFAAIATEFNTGHEIWLTRGRLVDALQRLLCPARHFPARADRRPLAGRRRAGQSGAGIGGARARRAARDRGQSQCRPVRPRHHHRKPRLRRGGSGSCRAARGADADRLARHFHARAVAAPAILRHGADARVFRP